MKQEARELEKQLHELAHHYDDSLKMVTHSFTFFRFYPVTLRQTLVKTTETISSQESVFLFPSLSVCFLILIFCFGAEDAPTVG